VTRSPGKAPSRAASGQAPRDGVPVPGRVRRSPPPEIGARRTSDAKRAAKSGGSDVAHVPDPIEELVRDGPNADRARAAHAGIEALRGDAEHADRLTPEIVASLIGGVATSRGGELGVAGVMGSDQAIEAAEVLLGVDGETYAALAGALTGAGSQTERALILEAIAARRELLLAGIGPARDQIVADPFTFAFDGAEPPPEARDPLGEIVGFASDIAGTPREDLLAATSLIARDGTDSPTQAWTRSCAATSALYAYAELDPVLALMLTSHPDRAAALEAALLGAAGQVATPRGEGGSFTAGLAVAPTYSQLGVDRAASIARQSNGLATVTYADRGHWPAIDQALRRGDPVPIRTSAFPDPTTGQGGHYVIATDVRHDGDETIYLITDPWTGHTAWVARGVLETVGLPAEFGDGVVAGEMMDAYVEAEILYGP
jgi:hypothetical protein